MLVGKVLWEKAVGGYNIAMRKLPPAMRLVSAIGAVMVAMVLPLWVTLPILKNQNGKV